MAGDDIQDKPGREKHRAKPALVLRLFRAWLISNAILLTVCGGALWVGHRWVTSSEENFEAAIVFGGKYPVALAGLVEIHKLNPVHIEKMGRLAEKILVDGAGMGSKSDAHLYWQGRLLMAMPVFYATLGLTEDELARRERAIGLFAGLAQRNPAKTDYRRRLAVTHNLQAEALQRLGRHEAAIGQWKHQRRIADGLLAEEPGHWRWRWYVAISELGIGESLQALGSAAAPGHVLAARTIARTLCQERAGDDRMCELARKSDKAAAAAAAAAPGPG